MPFNNESPFDILKVYLPQSLIKEIKRLAQEQYLPVSRLILYAIDNEMGRDKPFEYDSKLPTDPYVLHAYTEEAQQIYRYMYKFPTGLSRDQLLACRRDVGIESKDALLHGLRELLTIGLLEEQKPSGKSKFKGYKSDYKILRFARDAAALRKKEIASGPKESKSVLDEA